MKPVVLRADARSLPLADASVDLIVTSPPYWSLRSYTDTPELCARCRELTGQGWGLNRPRDRDRDLRQAWPDWDAHVEAEHKAAHYDGQIGAEPTPAEYVDNLIACTREWVRVLKPSGSLWVNLGDKYAQATERSRNGHGGALDGGLPLRTGPSYAGSRSNGVPQKSLIGLPWRYALRCIDDLGLILRAEVIWSKPNGLPESVTDRVRRSHETWFHLVRSPRYFSAVDTIREEYAPGTAERYRTGYGPSARALAGATSSGVLRSTGAGDGGPTATNPLGKLPGSVWEIPTEPLKVPAELGIDHFAAGPTEWPRRIIQGWSPSGICTACGEGRRPVSRGMNDPNPALAVLTVARAAMSGGTQRSTLGRSASTVITGEACACPTTSAPTRPAVILDPFGGTGTTALVAHALGRHGISVDMSADYGRLAQWRTTDPDQLAKAMRVEKPPKQLDGQADLFEAAG